MKKPPPIGSGLALFALPGVVVLDCVVCQEEGNYGRNTGNRNDGDRNGSGISNGHGTANGFCNSAAGGEGATNCTDSGTGDGTDDCRRYGNRPDNDGSRFREKQSEQHS